MVDDSRYTLEAKRVLQVALREALSLGHNYVAPEHILLAMTRLDEGVVTLVLNGEQMRRAITKAMSKSVPFPKTMDERLQEVEATLAKLTGQAWGKGTA